ncbi:CYTH domain-containing protein [Pricia sp. S334]|uniref:CYTH domain-containing protein n=1 Tax=Pricia mediterranea TaxID=3076079 RepID=A0ABU3L4U1_9FLAO|nr:CYTH domain-containing protein [Pricia sp. S334]MDT7828749.1 CYTH domain-containing protein [Pricia sp. S334]
MTETERKFLVKSEAYKKQAHTRKRIVQGFLNTDPRRTVRIRIYGNTAVLTVKGMSNETGTTRFEWEREIGLKEAQALLELCEKDILEKTRFEIPVGEHLFEVDEFHGLNKGLILAEVELKHENEPFEKPDWLGEEVTGDVRYYNSQLSKQAYKTWKN